ncbi:hypothetical protein QPL77_14540 [Bacillus pumilus]|uniref:hypothetical protein n=1 Tax=Bacillus TaxID=1386 RepID=UPI002283163E|nr:MULTISPECIES: hypothetical protein [Bacillus]MCY7439421.1 hypothetical protein [Bacillus altitudinis]MEC1142459.1 hypothetical protein [Bacillus altitudinis]WIG31193.1 hypothetical protein QPL77_14540 [Bacillus pumilus]
MTKEELHEAITALYERTKAGTLERKERIVEINDLLESYDGTPPTNALERISDLILYEELSDTRRNKMTAEEYPIMSERMEKTRKTGEASDKMAEEYDITGANYAVPKRRTRSPYDNLFTDRHAKSRNKSARKRYNAFVNGKSSGQFTVNIATGIKTVRSDAQ